LFAFINGGVEMKKTIFFFLPALLFALSACGGGGGSSAGSGGGGSTVASGSVALFVTDDLADYSEVSTTINSISILHKGSGASCPVLSEPVTLDIAELSSELLLLEVSTCPARPYNRINIELSSAVVLTDANGNQATCTFVSYKDSENKPNVLQCDNENCSMEINGMVNVLVNENSELVLDFDLKEFEIENFGQSDCTVTMKVEPLNANDIDDKKRGGSKESIKGIVSELNTSDETFILKKKDSEYMVLFSNVDQPGTAELIQLSEDNQLKTRVKCSELDLSTNECTASEISVEVEGTITALGEGDPPPPTFDLEFNPTISVDYGEAVEIEGEIAVGKDAEVKLFGHNGTSYLAREVETED
jgi:hypothetical protein